MEVLSKLFKFGLRQKTRWRLFKIQGFFVHNNPEAAALWGSAHALSLCLVIQCCLRGTPLGFCCLRVMNEKPLNLEKTTSSVLSVILLIYLLRCHFFLPEFEDNSWIWVSCWTCCRGSWMGWSACTVRRQGGPYNSTQYNPKLILGAEINHVIVNNWKSVKLQKKIYTAECLLQGSVYFFVLS